MRELMYETEAEHRVKLSRSSDRLLAALKQHHDYSVRIPDGWVKPVPKPVVVEPPQPTFIEPWFKILHEVEPPMPELPMIEDVKRVVCKHFGITSTEITGTNRTHKFVRPRQIAIYLARNITGKSFPEIAKRLGRLDHTSAMAAYKRVQKLCVNDPAIAHHVAHLERAFQ